MKNLGASVTVFFVSIFFLSSAASAFDLTGRSRTYLLTRETTDTARLTPLYEYLNFKAESANTGAVSFNFSGWSRYDLQNESYNRRSDNDLQYAYLSIKTEKSNASLNLGRLLVHEGVASEQIDGIYARTGLMGGFGIAAYGGSPMETNFDDTRRGDTISGGRISHGVSGIYSLGISLLDEKNNNNAFRREEGVDLWLHPVSKLELQGMSSYNAMSRNWMQHNYYLSVGPFGPVRLSGEASKVTYKDYFTGTTLSAFTLPDINPDETVTTTGGSVVYAVTSSLAAVADYKNFNYDIAGRADYYGGKLSYAGGNFGAGGSLHTMHGADKQLQYDNQGLYLYGKISKADISLQGFHTWYKQPINGVKHTYSATASAGYAFTPKAKVSADVEYEKTPDFHKDVRAMVTLVYLFDLKFEPKVKKTVLPKKK